MTRDVTFVQFPDLKIQVSCVAHAPDWFDSCRRGARTRRWNHSRWDSPAARVGEMAPRAVRLSQTPRWKAQDVTVG